MYGFIAPKWSPLLPNPEPHHQPNNNNNNNNNNTLHKGDSIFTNNNNNNTLHKGKSIFTNNNNNNLYAGYFQIHPNKPCF
jgi:hypothetical protein